MTQAELAATIAEAAGISKTAGAAALKRLTDEITKQLKKGQEVRIAGLGTFRVTKRGARTARNPRTGEPIKLKASKQAKFSPSATLKNALNPARGAASVAAVNKRSGAPAAAKKSTKQAAARRVSDRRR